MAKKKKQAVNPARGFATSSVASKANIEKQKVEVTPTETPQQLRETPQVAKPDLPSRPEPSEPINELLNLTPEEFEQQLEQNELQMLVDKCAAKVRRDSSRQISKLQTDCRRSQEAQSLALNQWLSGDLLSQIFDLIKGDASETGYAPQASFLVRKSSEEELLIKCWTLFETLSGVGVAQDCIMDNLKKLLKNPPYEDPGSYIWGLRESLDMLALDLDEARLPNLIQRKQNTTVHAISQSNSGLNSSSETPKWKRDKYGQQSEMASTPSTSRTSTPEPTSSSRVPARKSKPDPPSAPAVQEDVSVSDIESDLQPDELVSTYLTIKERMYRLHPELDDSSNGKAQVRKFGGKVNHKLKASPESTPSWRKLQSKLDLIESDILFDKDEALALWTAKRNQLAQVAALERRLQPLAIRSESPKKPSAIIPDEGSTGEESESVTDSGDDGLGDMFTEPGGEVTNLKNSESSTGPTIILRDFGKAVGMSPRRVLDDACRARDPGVKLNFKLISRSSFTNRHMVVITWSRDQPRLLDTHVPWISVVQKSSSRDGSQISEVSFGMIGIATPDQKQSEGFVSTVALFYLLSSAAKEDKAWTKLPAAWRELYTELGDHLKEQTDIADRETLKLIRGAVFDHSKTEEEDGVVLASAFRGRTRGLNGTDSSRDQSESKAASAAPSKDLMALWARKASTRSYQYMLTSRMTLPMFGFREAALAMIDGNQVVILCGETGCGKSTQLPAYILEHELARGNSCKIYCTQPRRISAVSLARRVSEELGEAPGELGTPRSLVGYAIRLESRMSPQTRLVYSTIGIVLRMLESSLGLDDITHLIIDEVHERSIDTDFLLIVMRSLILRRPELKVILMSATIDANRISRYLGGAPIIEVPGRTFPVQTRFLEDAIELTHYSGGGKMPIGSAADSDTDVNVDQETSGIPKQLQGYSSHTRKTLETYDEYRIDYDLIIKLMERVASDPIYIDYSKAILVFLPGMAEIRELNDMLVGSNSFMHNTWIIPLHSSIATEDQQRAFSFPPPGVRKIVLATNIAETGITIPDITCVIDTGKHKEMRYDERRQLSRLIQSFISRANAKQRRGRAGRVQEGLCFHLFTRYRHDELMAPQQTPEMLRLSLQDLVMRVKVCGLGDVEQTLSDALDPPSSKNIQRAVDALIEVGALTTNEDLTSLGNQLAKLPLDASLGKLCLLSAIFGCLDMGLTVAAILSSKSPFITPFGAKQRADSVRLAFAKGDSDLLTAYNAYCAWRKVAQSPDKSVAGFCHKNFLSNENLTSVEDLKAQLLTALGETGLLKVSSIRQNLNRYGAYGRGRPFVQMPEGADINSDNEVVTTAVIAWSFYPKLLVRDGKGWRNVANSQSVSLHPSSVNKRNPNLKYVSYYSMMQMSGNRPYNAMSTNGVQDLPLMLLAGEAEFKVYAGLVVIDGNRMRWKIDGWKGTIALKVFRKKMEEIVEKKLKAPTKDLSPGLKRWMAMFEQVCANASLKDGKRGS
ncbi:ATP-dependent RNA helicase A [Trichodelitschia bisporula]|uniref:RNA helicase n=1 Tax=Trichodelitschia bisporula TaxID=703511 RepID=A0A6G1I216_9PEZI|nr:ATP-dependent RNA helicase A [Trichodelitschia bisporula]